MGKQDVFLCPNRQCPSSPALSLCRMLGPSPCFTRISSTRPLRFCYLGTSVRELGKLNNFPPKLKAMELMNFFHPTFPAWPGPLHGGPGAVVSSRCLKCPPLLPTLTLQPSASSRRPALPSGGETRSHMWFFTNTHTPCFAHSEAQLVVFLSKPWHTPDGRSTPEKAGRN